MLEVSIRLLAANERVGREIAAARIINDGTGNAAYGNYDVYITDGDGYTNVEPYRVDQFPRERGASALVGEALRKWS